LQVAIIVFSPTGNTLKVAKMLKEALLTKKVKTQIIDVTRDPILFKEKKMMRFLNEKVASHDVLCIGSPVYAHHLQYHVKDLIRSLPKPGNGWSKLAIPYVTYGGISSGIALPEAAKLLKRSGRIPVLGMKINAEHCFTRLEQITTRVNEGMPGEEAIPLIEELAKKIIQLDSIEEKEGLDISPDLRYQKFRDRIKAHLLFREKFWQAHLYPKLRVDLEKCTQCGKCSEICPVQSIEITRAGPIVQNGKRACIHCGLCVVCCPANAIDLDVDWPRWNRLLEKAAAGQGFLPSNEHPKSAVYG
jgi:ferredoxin/flavodoxin